MDGRFDDDKAYIFYLDDIPGNADISVQTNNSGSWSTSSVTGSGNVGAIGNSAVTGVRGRSHQSEPKGEY